MELDSLDNRLKISFQRGNWDIESDPDCITLISVIRNEELLLESFIKHYDESGVTHFVFFDNLSTDNSHIILSKYNELNIRVYNAHDSYRDASYGTEWVTRYMLSQPLGSFYIIVDVDEYLISQDNHRDQIKNLAKIMKNKNYVTMPAMLIDMYSSEKASTYMPGEMPWVSNDSYDRYNNEYYTLEKSWQLLGLYSGITGGVRKRLFKLDRICLNKFPILKFSDKRLSVGPGCHTIKFDSNDLFRNNAFGLPSDPEPIFLLHFKFIKPNMHDFVRERVIRNQDWDNSAEYREYLDFFNNPMHNGSFLGKYSQRFITYTALKNEFKEVFGTGRLNNHDE